MRSSRDGVTITELMVAMAIMTIGVLGMFGAFRYINVALHVARGKTLATNLAQERVEALKNLPYYELLLTTESATDSSVTPAVLYDEGNYPPETISIGGIAFTRYTYVAMVDVTDNVIVSAAGSFPDTGMKQITVTIVWADGAARRQWVLNNLLENPNVNPLDSTLSGYAATTAGTRLAGVYVSVPQYPDYSAVADGSGNYSFRVYHGTYTVMMSTPGYFDWASPTVSVSRGGTTVVNSAMIPIASGTVAGIAWYNPNVVISQVVASTVEGNNFDAEYVELFNPTTAEIDVATTGGSPLLNLNYGSGNNQYCANIPLVYVSTFVASDRYYLIANTATVTLNGIPYQADAYYNAMYLHGNCAPWNGLYWNASNGYDLIQNSHSGLLWLADSSGRTVDAVGWFNASGNPQGCSGRCAQTCPGTCIPFPNGATIVGEQLVRISSPAASLDPAAMNAYGRAYNSSNNNEDFFYPRPPTSYYGIQFPPKNTQSGAFPPLTGVPAVGAYVSAGDYNSGSTQTYAASIASGSLTLAYAPFTLVGVATGTWSLDVSLGGGYYEQVSDVAIPAQGSVVGVPNAATSPAWVASGLHHVPLSSASLNGFVKGQVKDPYGQALSGITVQCAGVTKLTDVNGLYYMSVSSGPVVVVANPNNANPSYVQQLIPDTVYTGTLATDDVTLAQGGVLTGYMTTGTTPVPNVTVTANLGGSQMGAAVSNPSGVFTIRNLPTGTYTVQPALDVGQNSAPPSYSATLTSAGGTVFAGTFTVTGAFGNIAGTVTNNGALVTSGALILASTGTLASTPPSIAGSSAPALSPIYAVSSRADGTYTLPVRGASAYNVGVYLPVLQGTAQSSAVSTTFKSYSGVSVSPGGTTTQNISLP